MPLRPSLSFNKDRPSSAIYIGNGAPNATTASSASTSTHKRTPSISNFPQSLQDLPEPPSPVLSSSSSGLPSPPATNSTGSGSTGDPTSAAGTAPRRAPTSNPRTTRKTKSSHHATNSVSELDTEGDSDLLDEDHTARIRSAALGRHAMAAASSENVAALHRVKSLAERNKLALNKLTLMARLTPAPSSRVVSSPVSSSSSPSSSGRSRNRASLPPPVLTPQEPPLSGSETERESTSPIYAYHPNSSSPSLHDMANLAHAPTIAYQTPPPQQPTRSKHHRISSLASASVSTPYLPSTSRAFQTPSPHAQPLTKTRSIGGANTPSTSSSGGSTGRTRLTLASTSGSGTSGNGEADLITGNPKRRHGSGSGGNVLSTPSVASTTSEVRGEDTRAQIRRNEGETEEVVLAALAAVESSRSSRNSLDARRRNVFPREYRRDEVVVEDDDYPADPVTPYRNGNTASQLRSLDRERVERGKGRETRLSVRGGSAESALSPHDPPPRTVVGEVFKAMGLSPKRNRRLEREREQEKGGFLKDGDVFEERVPLGEFADRRARLRDRDREPLESIGPRSVTSLSQRRYPSRSRSRAQTNGAGSDEEDSENDVMKTSPAGLRAHRHTYSTPRELDAVHLSSMKKDRDLERERDREVITGRSMTSLSKYSAISTPPHQIGSSTVSSALPRHDKHGASFYGNWRGSAPVMSNHTGSTAPGDSERAPSRLSALVPIERTEHARLMAESLAMFEGHMNRILSGDGSGVSPTYITELVKSAQGIVSSAERVNGVLRSASKNALEQEIDAEVADDLEVGRGSSGMYSAREMVQVWKRVNADYKEGVKASDELVRGITTLLLGIGKVLKDIGSDGASVVSSASIGSASTHTRSVSLNDEDIARTRGSSPSLSSGIGRRSVDVGGRLWEVSPSARPAAAMPPAANPVEEAYRRLTITQAQPSSSGRPRERDHMGYESPLAAHPPQPESAFMTPASSRSSTSLVSRRLLIPREQREQEHEERLRMMSSSEDLVASTSQETIVPYDPSPSPAPRIRNSLHKSLPPLTVSKALPSLPSTSSHQQNGTPEQDYRDISETSSSRGHERRKASNSSISTVRGGSVYSACPPYPAALNPSSGGATTAVTTHTVSTASPVATSSSVSGSSILSSAESRKNVRSSVTFSRPSTESVPTLAGLQLQHEERQRTSMGEVRVSVPPTPSTPMSGSETERPPKRQTWGARTGHVARGMSAAADASFIDDFGRVSLGRAADRSAASLLRKDRRMVTEVFPRS